MKKIFNISMAQFGTWIKDKRMIYLVLLVFFLDQQIISAMHENVLATGEKYAMLEPFIAISSTMWLQIIIPAIYLLLMYDFPSVYGGRYFYLVRTGRDKWYWGQILFSVLCTLVYSAIIVAVTVIVGMGNIEFKADWSNLVVNGERIFDANNLGTALIKPSTFYQGRMWMVFGYNFLFCSLNLLLCNMVQLAFFAFNHPKIGYFACLGINSLGAVLAYVTENVRWAFPTANAVFSFHFTDYLAKPKYPIYMSVLYFLIIIGALIISGLFGIMNTRLAEGTEK